MIAWMPLNSRATFQISSVGPVSPEKTTPEVPSWMMKPVPGTAWWTGTGRTVRVPNSAGSRSRSVWSLSAGFSGVGSFVKSGQSRLLKQ